jgi:hypothetical protein
MISIDAAGLALYKGGVVPCHVLGGDVNHAVTVVGYFDGVTSHNGEVLDVYLVRNRCVWCADMCGCLCLCAWQLKDMPLPPSQPQPPNAPWPLPACLRVALTPPPPPPRSWGTWWGSGNARAGYAGHVLIRKDCVLPLEDTLDNPGIAPIAAV